MNVRKGETYEFKAELNSEYRDRRKETVKRVIAAMTVGKDVSGLFADVVKNMQTDDLELKKLVYLYLVRMEINSQINYAKTKPELVILCVNTFVKDTSDYNPLIRALAIRTMGCLRVERMVDYLVPPLTTAVSDPDPYVRKTAALCVAKLFDLAPRTALDTGLVAALQDMVSDSNPMVISNAVAALGYISRSHPGVFALDASRVAKLLAAINECSEWSFIYSSLSQICILESMASYSPPSSQEAWDIVERVVPRLQHANASVVLAAVNLLIYFMDLIGDNDRQNTLIKKLSPPLVTLLSEEAEIQYVALRNINLILQKRNSVLTQEIRVFFTKYNDPLYVKLEKLEVIIKLATERNIDQVLSELREYANEVDIEFVRRSVRSIGRCAIKIDSSSEKCVNVLLELIKSKTGVNHIVQEAIIVIKYPLKYEGIIPTLCENLESLDQPEAKASLIWIIGEYADRIQNSQDLLTYFAESFPDEICLVKHQILTASIKLFLKQPGQGQQLVNTVLAQCTQGSDNPDIRDRAYVYWRLLSSDPRTAQAVVLAEKPPISYEGDTVSESLLDELCRCIGSLASVYHISPSLLDNNTAGVFISDDEQAGGDGDSQEEINMAKQSGIGDLLGFGDATTSTTTAATNRVASSSGGGSGIDDLLGMMDMGGGGGAVGINYGVMSNPGGAPVPSFSPAPVETVVSDVTFPAARVLTSQDAQGMEISISFGKRGGKMYIEYTIVNETESELTEFATQYNTNSFGLVPLQEFELASVPAHATATSSQEMGLGGGIELMEPANLLQIAIKNNVGVFYMSALVPDGLI